MDELRRLRDLGMRGEALAQPVFDRFHVVVGRGFERLHAFGIGEREARDGVIERGARVGGERGQGGERGLVGERLQPGDLDAHAVADQREFAEMFLQGPRLRGVAPVEGGEGGEG